MVMTWLASLLVKGAEDFTNTELKFNNKAFSVCSKLKKKEKRNIYYHGSHFARGETKTQGSYTVGFRACPSYSELQGSTGTRWQSKHWASGLPTPLDVWKVVHITGSAVQTAWSTMGKLLRPSVPQCYQLENGDNSQRTLITKKLNELVHVKTLRRGLANSKCSVNLAIHYSNMVILV